MKVLVIGDSIVRGKTGVNWLRILAKRHKNWQFENAGIEGDTLTKIGARLENKLQESAGYDVIVIVAGTNDVIIPAFLKKGLSFRQAALYLLKNGYRPLQDPDEFEKKLRNIVFATQQKTSANIILATIGCINENLSSPVNRKRMSLNNVIRIVARQTGCRLADTGMSFEKHLVNFDTQNYFLDNFINTTWIDKLRCRLPGRADKISRRRRLHLTIDGVHLNTRGALLFADAIEKQMLLIKASSIL